MYGLKNRLSLLQTASPTNSHFVSKYRRSPKISVQVQTILVLFAVVLAGFFGVWFGFIGSFGWLSALLIVGVAEVEGLGVGFGMIESFFGIGS